MLRGSRKNPYPETQSGDCLLLSLPVCYRIHEVLLFTLCLSAAARRRNFPSAVCARRSAECAGERLAEGPRRVPQRRRAHNSRAPHVERCARRWAWGLIDCGSAKRFAQVLLKIKFYKLRYDKWVYDFNGFVTLWPLTTTHEVMTTTHDHWPLLNSCSTMVSEGGGVSEFEWVVVNGHKVTSILWSVINDHLSNVCFSLWYTRTVRV